MNEQLVRTPQGGILYEPELFGKTAGIEPGQALFTASYWFEQQVAQQMLGGRDSVVLIHDDRQAPPLLWVLRHYRRGGLIAKVLSDRYLWLGAAATRAFREWRLLAQMRARYLPVPIPVAASYVRCGCSYRADLITQEIIGARSLTQRLSEANLSPELWQRVGATLARFHVLGVQHADLNANNIILDAADEIYVLDFDRGRMRTPRPRWIKRVLARLLRSLTKLHAQRRIHFSADDWRLLVTAHDEHLMRLSKQQD